MKMSLLLLFLYNLFLLKRLEMLISLEERRDDLLSSARFMLEF